jgi:arylsulfatase A-like enzyme
MNGDHGLLFKGNFLDAAIRIPLIVRPPLGTGAAAARRDRSLVELIDVGATIADYAGAVRPAASHAVSLRPAIEDAAPGPRDAAITEFLGHVALIDAEWKIELAPDETATLLFDRNRDPGEQTNLAHDERHRAVVERLRARVRAFRAGSASAVSAGSA